MTNLIIYSEASEIESRTGFRANVPNFPIIIFKQDFYLFLRYSKYMLMKEIECIITKIHSGHLQFNYNG